MKPLPGSILFQALKGKGAIIMACNCRVMPGVIEGIFRAAKDTDSAVMFEMARTESNLEGGYTGITPKMYGEYTMKVAEKLGFEAWALHADHIGIKKGTREDIEGAKKLIEGQIAAGYTSFAIDASHLYNYEGKNTYEELKPNIDVTIELGKFIKEKMAGREFGLECEVGEVGKKDANGMVLTTPDEATTYISKLNEAGVRPHVLATANGSTHGNVFDDEGNPIEQVSIDIQRTKDIVAALAKMGSDVKIAQHGITGTPLHLIEKDFPHGDILKGNVATYWQNIVFDKVKEFQPELYKEIYEWTLSNFKEKMPGKKDIEIFGKMSKKANKPFFEQLNNLKPETLKAVEETTYEEAKKFFKAFKAEGSASIVKKYMEGM